jgi:glycerol-3-phosphate O-acyltransferase
MRFLFKRAFGQIEYPPEAAEKIKEYHKDAVVIYVARNQSFWLVLYFNYILLQLGLPLARFIGGTNLLIWQPLRSIWKMWKQRRNILEQDWRHVLDEEPQSIKEALMAENTLREHPSLLLIDPPRGLYRKPRRHQPENYLRILLELQKKMDKPIIIVPHVVTSRDHGGVETQGLRTRILGDRHQPSTFKKLVLPLTSFRKSLVRVGDSINLKEYLKEHQQSEHEKLSRRLQHELNRTFSDEERVVAGPPLPQFDVISRHIHRDQALQEVLKLEAEKTGLPLHTIERKAEHYLKEIAANYTPRMLYFVAAILNWVFHRIYDGIVLDKKGLERAVNAGRHSPVVFCPSHRSHVDYLILSLSLWNAGITPPHIAAGVNLSFFPLGIIFRACGAFFLRRSFRDNPLYGLVLKSYVKELMRAGVSSEFFIEGGRSRTGKLLMPKFGILTMLINAWRSSSQKDLQFVPVSIDYEKIVEAGSYERELSGREKKSEDLAGLLKTTKVLRSRYGRLHVQFGEPLSLNEFINSYNVSAEFKPENEEVWRGYIERLGYKILSETAKVTTVTPTSVVATALLGHQGRGMSHDNFLQQALEIVLFLEDNGARLSPPLHYAQTREAALTEAIKTLNKEELVIIEQVGRDDKNPIYRIPDEKRLRLDYYKNGVMNHFAPAATVARSIIKQTQDIVSYEKTYNESRKLSRILKREFVYGVGINFGAIFDETLATLAFRGFIDVHENGEIHIRERESLELLAGLLDSFVQSYWTTAKSLRALQDFPLWDKELEKRAIEANRRDFLEGTISRPEAASKTLISGALDIFQALNLLKTEQEGKRKTYHLTPDAEAGKLEEMIGDIRQFL